MKRSKTNTQYLIPRPYARVGRYLQKMRLQTGLTQREVSEILGYSSPQFISNFERGISLPPRTKLRTLVVRYKLDTTALIEMILECQRSELRHDFLGRKKA